MKDDSLSRKSMALGVAMMELVKELQEKREFIVSRQIGRSGTSVGANIREAQYAHSRADFISKQQIALKESNETDYWIELLFRSGYIDSARYHELDRLCSDVRVMLISSIRTAKANEGGK